MFKLFLQLICLPCIVLAINQMDLTGQWDWIKSYRGGFAGGWETPADRGYSMRMIIRNDSVYIYHDDTLVQSDSLQSLIHTESGTEFELHSDTLIIKETLVEAVPASYWKKATTTPEKRPILFLYSVTNYAWGYTHKGWFIDSSGTVYDYDFTQADSIGYINHKDTLPLYLYDKLSAKGVPTGNTIPGDTLLMMQSLIEPAAGGQVSYSGICRDFGMYRYSAIWYDTFPSGQKEIICYQIGDMGACNSAVEARQIAVWLNSIDSMDLEHCNPPDSCLNIATSTTEKRFPARAKPVLTERDGVVMINIPKNGTVVIRPYSLRGELLAEPVEMMLPAGDHCINMAHVLYNIRGNKPLVLEISAGNSGLTTRRVVISRTR